MTPAATPAGASAGTPVDLIENVTFDEIRLDQTARLLRTLTHADLRAAAALSGDAAAADVGTDDAEAARLHGNIGQGLWEGALVSSLLGNVFPGPGTTCLDQRLNFGRPVRVGDTLELTATVIARDASTRQVELDCQALNQRGERVLHGTVRVVAPAQKVRRARSQGSALPPFDAEARLQALLDQGRDLPPVPCAVVHPCDADSLRGAVDATRLGLIDPVLVGPEARIRAIARAEGIDLTGLRIHPVEHSHAAADAAAQMAADQQVRALMKGSLHTDELIHAVLAQRSLRTGRRMSHVFRFEVPAYPKPLLITDAALNIAPTLEEKVDIVQNAIHFARLMGVPAPKVAILSAVETVNPAIPSTLDAAALCKMAQRGQITGGVIDGPLAFDNAISMEAAHIKHIESAVAGDADILVVPDLESGNMLAKQLAYLAGATASGLVLGARVPIALTSRADGAQARIASALLLKLVAHRQPPAA